jgi:tight adherence protein B
MESAGVISLLVFFLVAEAVWLIAPAPAMERGAVAERVTSYVVPLWEPKQAGGVSVMRRARLSRIPWLDALLDRFNLAAGLSSQLVRAGIAVRAGEFLFIQLALVSVVAIVAVIVLSSILGVVTAAAVGALLGLFVPLGWLRFKVGRRVSEFEQALPDALDLIAGSLRAGFGLPHGLDLVSRGNEGPIAEEFGQVLHEVNLGSDLEVSLARILERIDSDDVRLLATAVAVQRRTGGNLVEVLGQLAGVMRERQRLRRDLHVITTAPRVSGYVVALLPVLTAAMMFITSRYYIDTLLSSPTGRIAALVGAVLVGIGLFINRRIATVDF